MRDQIHAAVYTEERKHQNNQQTDRWHSKFVKTPIDIQRGRQETPMNAHVDASRTSQVKAKREYPPQDQTCFGNIIAHELLLLSLN